MNYEALDAALEYLNEFGQNVMSEVYSYISRAKKAVKKNDETALGMLVKQYPDLKKRLLEYYGKDTEKPFAKKNIDALDKAYNEVKEAYDKIKLGQETEKLNSSYEKDKAYLKRIAEEKDPFMKLNPPDEWYYNGMTEATFQSEFKKNKRKLARWDKGSYLSAIEDNFLDAGFDEESMKKTPLYKLISENECYDMSNSRYTLYLYLPKYNKFFEFNRDSVKEDSKCGPSSLISYQKLLEIGKTKLKEDPNYVKADKELGYNRLS
jgi:hypothetical protein